MSGLFFLKKFRHKSNPNSYIISKYIWKNFKIISLKSKIMNNNTLLISYLKELIKNSFCNIAIN